MSSWFWEALLRLFRRSPAASRTMPLRTASAEQPASSRIIPSPGVAGSGAGMTPDLELLLANGRAAAERLAQAIEPSAERAKPKPTKFTAQCMFCLEPFDHEPRTPHELEPLRQVLLIPGHAVTAPIDICDACYEKVMTSAVRPNGHTGVIDIGVSNSGPPNMALQRLSKPAA
jgi:hypothetical protein